MRIIDLENHFTTPLLVDTLKKRTEAPRIDPVKGLAFWEDAWFPTQGSDVFDNLFNVGEGRIKQMDECGIDFAQLSLNAPGADPYDAETSKIIAEDANNVISGAVARHPDRFGAFITLAPKDPEWSLKEIDRCLEMGMWGWFTHSNFKDAYIDEKRFWPLLEKCERLDMPIYVHPAATTAKELRSFGICLAAPALGFTVDVLYCVMRMIHRGVFDAFPNLKIILGHFGEGFPFFLDRVNAAYRQGFGQPDPEMGGYEHEPSYYIKNNVWTTTSGNFLPEALYCTRDVMGIDKITMATDHPYEIINKGVDMIVKDVPLTEDEKEAFLGGNAKALGFARGI